MSVSNYTPNHCKYSDRKLNDVVFLVDCTAIGVTIIDSGNAYIDDVDDNYVMTLGAYNISLSENESIDERYEFLHTLNFSINGYKNITDLLEKYYVILNDLDNNFWVLNPRTPCKVAYTYTIGANEDHTDFTFSTKSNFPMLRLANFNFKYTKPCNHYKYNAIKKLYINETNYSRVGTGVTYTNDGFKEVEFNKDSCVLQEIYDGNIVSHEVQFKINLDNYKSSWHYNLLEFTNNKYAVVIKSDEVYYAVGFHYGLQPSYEIEGSNSDRPNIITITLKDYHDQGYLLQSPSVNFDYNSGTTWVYVSNEYECVTTNTAKHLLKEELDIYGNPLDKYMCLTGYTEKYEYLGDKLIGEFEEDDTIYFPCNACVTTECTLNTSLPSDFEFTKKDEVKTFSLMCTTDWQLNSSNTAITVSPTSGNSNTLYTVTVTNNSTPTSSAATYTLTASYCFGQTKSFNVTVRKPQNILPNGTSYTVMCDGYNLTIPTTNCVSRVTSNKDVVTDVQIQNGYIKLRVNPYDCSTIILTITLCDGETIEAYINPEQGAEYRTISGTPYCTGYDKYVVVTTEVSYNSGSTWEFYSSAATLVEAQSSDCGYVPPQYRWTNSGTTCSGSSGYDKYNLQVYEVSYDSGSTWSAVTPTQTRLGTLIEANSEDCGYVPPTPVYRWVQTTDTICVEDSVPYSAQYLTFESTGGTTEITFTPTSSNVIYYSLDSGSTWIQGNSVSLENGHKVLWKGTMTPINSEEEWGIGQFSMRGYWVNVEGNIMSLLYGDNFSGQTTLNGKDVAFHSLFEGCVNLWKVENLILPSTSSMACYMWMFYGCRNIETAPELPATTLTDYCYYEMFNGCSKLSSITCLATDISADSCTYSWVYGVASSGTFVKNPSMTSWTSGSSGIPSNWTVINYQN